MRTPICISFAALCLLGMCQAEDPQEITKVSIGPAVEALYSSSATDSRDAERRLIGERTILIQSLIASIQTHRSELATMQDSTRVKEVLRGMEAAMNVLGEIRSVEAVPLLSDMIDFPQVIPTDLPKDVQRAWSIHVSPGAFPSLRMIESLEDDIAQYPAANALAKIGEPCVPGVMKRLLNSRSAN